MKPFFTAISLLVLLYRSAAQEPIIDVSTQFTTSLQFHRPIRHVDVGSTGLLVQAVAAADSILLLKAAVPDFSPTNLTVLTSDGVLHVFRVRYAAAPPQWRYPVPEIPALHPRQIAAQLLLRDPWLHGVRTRAGDVGLRLTGIYVRAELLYFVLQLDNPTAFPYALDGIHVLLRDRKPAKRAALQELPVTPVFLQGDTSLVPSFGQGKLVIAIERLTLGSAQLLVMELPEQRGGRHLTLRLRPRKLLQAKLVD